MKLRDMFISEEQLATDSLIREIIEEKWLREAQEENAEEPDERPASEGDDFGDEPDEFVDKDVSYIEDEKGDEEEFRGAPADPLLAPGFDDEPEASTFSDDPVFGEVPEPSADPESPLWHSNIDLDDAGDHRSSVSFPDYEGPTHRDSDHSDDKPDEKGFYPRPKTSTKKSRR